jgi:hypothetical protein
MAEKAWGQGFTSRVIMIFSDERIVGDDFIELIEEQSPALKHDLQKINSLYGHFLVTPEYRQAVNNWRALGEAPAPNHPKLVHYVTRRRVHLYKLSMVSSADRGDDLTLTKADFNRAMNWLTHAEKQMPDIFKAGATSADGAAMAEILHYIMINEKGWGVSEQKITRFASDRIPITSILRVIEIMEGSGQIILRGIDKNTKVRYFTTPKPETDDDTD